MDKGVGTLLADMVVDTITQLTDSLPPHHMDNRILTLSTIKVIVFMASNHTIVIRHERGSMRLSVRGVDKCIEENFYSA